MFSGWWYFITFVFVWVIVKIWVKCHSLGTPCAIFLDIYEKGVLALEVLYGKRISPKTQWLLSDSTKCDIFNINLCWLVTSKICVLLVNVVSVD